jgi:hypothetical protein
VITLTLPAVVNSVLGGTGPINYNKFVLSYLTYDTVSKIVTSRILISSTANPEMQAIEGTMTINTTSAKLTIAVPQLDFYRQVVLTAPQNAFVSDSVIVSSQNTIEAGLISLGVVAGVQSTGS